MAPSPSPLAPSAEGTPPVPALGIVCADHALVGAAVELLRACARPEESALFLMDDAVLDAGDPRLRALADQGAEVVLCAADALAHGVGADPGGPRHGSQYDHAVLVRDAERVITLTGARVDDWRPGARRERHVIVRLTREASHPKTAQGLRAAVGYAGVDLQITVLVEPAARALLAHADHGEPLVRALAALRGLGHTIMGAAPGLRPREVDPDVVITW